MQIIIILIKIEKSDGFSEQICLKCLDFLSKAYSFKKLCEDSDYKFRNNLIMSDKIKSEEDTLISYDEIDNNYIKENINQNRNQVGLTQVKEDNCDDEMKPHNKSGEDQDGVEDEKTVTARHLNRALKSIVCEDRFNLENSQCTAACGMSDSPYKCEQCNLIIDTKKDFLHTKIHSEEQQNSDYELRSDVIITDVTNFKSELSEEDTTINFGEIHMDIKEITIKSESFNIEYLKSDQERDRIEDEDLEQYAVSDRSATSSYKCKFRSKTTESSLVLHKKSPTRDQQFLRTTNLTLLRKPFECAVCAKQFRHKYRLKRHSVVHTGEKLHKCRCDICNKSFTNSSTLTIHLRSHSGEKPYKCDVCDKKFAGKGDLVRHVRLHTGEKPYKCDVCHKTFTQSGSITVHMRSHSGEKPYNCDICHKSFTGSSNFRRHVKLHTKDKQYKCDVCEEKFAAKRYLVEHVKLHSGKKLFNCEVCHKKFTVNSNLKVHMRLHSGEKPFKCDICQKTFIVSSNLKVHMRVHSE